MRPDAVFCVWICGRGAEKARSTDVREASSRRFHALFCDLRLETRAKNKFGTHNASFSMLLRVTPFGSDLYAALIAIAVINRPINTSLFRPPPARC